MFAFLIICRPLAGRYADFGHYCPYWSAKIMLIFLKNE